MSKELIVSVNGREKKIAIVEDDVVTEFYVERGDENQGIVGNIYKGRVMKVLPGMQSAFVDIGLERDSFLYVSDFFDEEVDDEEVEEAREVREPQRLSYRERQRQAREAAYAAAREPEDEREAELAAAAIAHIEDLTEEPLLEPAPGDELLTAAGVGVLLVAEPEEAEEAASVRQRRQRRLRYAEREIEEAVPVEAPAEAEETAEAQAEAAEAVESEDGATGRRRRRRRRRVGPAGVAELEETEFAPEAVEWRAVEAADTVFAAGSEGTDDLGELVAEGAEPASKPFIIVHHNPFERVLDEEPNGGAGDMLKDAMVQEKIAGKIHVEELRTTLIEVEPTPDVRVGSLGALELPAGFERISDDSDDEAAAELPPTDELPELPALAEATEPLAAPGELVATAVADEAETAASDDEPIIIDRYVEPVPETPADSPVLLWPETERRVREFFSPPERRTKDFPAALAEPEPEPAPAAFASVKEERQPGKKEIAVVELAGDVELLPLKPTEENPTNESIEDEPLADASAQVRQGQRRADFAATRRGGRGRRRGFRQQRSPVTDATIERDEDEAATEVVEEKKPAIAPAPASPRNSSGHNGRYQRPVITDLLREGQEIIVQIAKEPIGQKGARITSHVALPGRYIVYMPTVEHIGVSRKIGTDEERQRLKRTLHTLRAEAGGSGGFIVRTAAHGCTTEELREDMQYLLRTWADIRRRADRSKAPAIVHRDLDLVQRILRDQLSSDFSAIRVDNELEYERMVDFVNRFAPKLVNRVKLYTKDTPILEHYSVQPEIDKAVKPRVWLRSGGYIVINQTEALVAIDVNTGKFVGKSNRLEDTIVKTNLEAAKEIVRQIRLRDLGGIIVLDFIDMEERRNRAKVLQALEYEMRNDKAPSKILQFNDFGLVAITRKRVKQSLERTLCTPCSYCGGGGMVKSAQTIAYEILAESRRISKDVDDANEVILRVHPEVAKALRGPERDVLNEIEAYLHGVITIKSDPTVHQEQFDIALV